MIPGAPGALDYSVPLVAAGALALSMALAKRILREVPPERFMFYRSLAGVATAVLFIPYVQVSGVSGGALGLLLLSAVLVPYGVNVLFFSALRSADAGSANAALQTTPVFVVLFDVVVTGTVAKPVAWLSLLVICCGAAILVGGRRHVIRGPAALLSIGAACVNGLGLVIISVILKDVGRATIMVAQNLAYVAIATGVFFRSTSDRGPRARRPRSVAKIVALSLCSGFLVQGVFFFLRLVSIQRLGPVVTSSLVLMQMPLTILFSFWLLGEQATQRSVVAAGLILLGGVGVVLAS